MNVELKGSQIFIYLSKVDWNKLPKVAASFMEPHALIKEHNATTLEIVASWANFRAERFVMQPELLPWEVELCLTMHKTESPLDPWLTLQFARDFAMDLGCAAWSDPPHLGNLPNSRWKIVIDGSRKPAFTSLVELIDHDIDWVDVKNENEIELRNFELHQTRLSYGKPRPARNMSDGL